MMESPKKANFMGVSKLGRSQSSLSRSPTIKSNIGSLSDLSELIEASDKSKEKFGRSLFSEIGRASKRSDIVKYQQQRRFEVQSLIPPLLLVILPFMWWYVKADSGQSWNWLAYTISLRFWLEASIAFLFLVTIMLCAKFALLYMNVGSKLQALYILRAAVIHSWGCLNTICSRPLNSLLAEEESKRNIKSGSQVVWTIGSKSKIERSKFYGEGVQKYSNGDSYEGEFYQGRCSGSGVYYFHMSGKYEGDWVDGKYDGYGVETWFRGSRYRGQYRQGMRDGYGIYRFHTGDVYSGEWSNGQSNGNGVQTCEDGSRYVGEFKNGMKHGFGYYHFRSVGIDWLIVDGKHGST
ncbi:hypothetical protein O6H91_01G036700 [Diphasiastrum complanatum]|uniref:Uncharacterized protein n=1 Tax=Diphasiastrum complanatum TaxID=34168 RepID=A0ACC2EQ24_DIPCM|nr:hypothetical protein O6H91_01G036700 [Diphasiastrum complanatum]